MSKTTTNKKRFFPEYIIDESVMELFNLEREKCIPMIHKNKAALNMLIIDKLIKNGSVQAMKLLYGIVNLDNPEQIYGLKGSETPINETDSTIKVEVNSKETQDNIEKL